MARVGLSSIRFGVEVGLGFFCCCFRVFWFFGLYGPVELVWFFYAMSFKTIAVKEAADSISLTIKI